MQLLQGHFTVAWHYLSVANSIIIITKKKHQETIQKQQIGNEVTTK